MDCKTGDIYRIDEAAAKRLEQQGKKILPLSDSLARELEPLGHNRRKNNMRNKPCVCGSGRKFKRCCWSNYA